MSEGKVLAQLELAGSFPCQFCSGEWRHTNNCARLFARASNIVSEATAKEKKESH